MIEQQMVAIENPCEFGEQCSDPKYQKVVFVEGMTASIILTVNVGEE